MAVMFCVRIRTEANFYSSLYYFLTITDRWDLRGVESWPVNLDKIRAISSGGDRIIIKMCT